MSWLHFTKFSNLNFSANEIINKETSTKQLTFGETINMINCIRIY